MRNSHSGLCYFCGEVVQKQQGHFERGVRGKWLTIHASCVFEQRKLKEEKILLDPNTAVILIQQPNYERVKTNLGVFERAKQHGSFSLWVKLGSL